MQLRLLSSPSDVCQRLMRLKACFPDADIAAMVDGRLQLMTDDDMAEVRG